MTRDRSNQLPSPSSSFSPSSPRCRTCSRAWSKSYSVQALLVYVLLLLLTIDIQAQARALPQCLRSHITDPVPLQIQISQRLTSPPCPRQHRRALIANLLPGTNKEGEQQSGTKGNKSLTAN
eukprot:270268-Rhodomonas_salina.1